MDCSVTEMDLCRMQAGKRYKGHECLLCAVRLCMEDERALNSITKSLYPAVAKALRLTRGSVERNIRYLIEKCWRDHAAYMQELAGYPLYRQPTNAEFIDILVRHEKETRRAERERGV